MLQLLILRKLSGGDVLCSFDNNNRSEPIHKVLAEGVRGSDVLVLMLSAKVLEQPACLLEVYTAIRNYVPILLVLVDGGGYNFEAARSFLNNLDSGLEATSPGCADALKELIGSGVVPTPAGERPASFEEMACMLGGTLPFLIASNFALHVSQYQVDGFVKDILDKVDRLITVKAVRPSLHDGMLALKDANSSGKFALNEASSGDSANRNSASRDEDSLPPHAGLNTRLTRCSATNRQSCVAELMDSMSSMDAKQGPGRELSVRRSRRPSRPGG